MITIRRKRGETLRLRFRCEGGLVGVQVSARLRGPVEVDLAATVTDPAAGVFELAATGDTATWPVGRYACDIRYARAGQVQRSPTFFIRMLEAIAP